MERILVVEDDLALSTGLCFELDAAGYVTQAAYNCRKAQYLIDEERFALVILDVNLPDGSGFDLCRRIKDKCGSVPVIFLTAKEEETDVVRGLDLGADDYVIKPFRNRELVSRIRGVLRRSGRGNPLLRCGDISVNTETGRVSRGGKEIALTKLEYRILSNMISYPGKLFTRDEILADIWDISGNFVNDNTLSVTMKRLREKLGDTDGQLIKTVRGMGYRLEP